MRISAVPTKKDKERRNNLIEYTVVALFLHTLEIDDCRLFLSSLPYSPFSCRRRLAFQPPAVLLCCKKELDEKCLVAGSIMGVMVFFCCSNFATSAYDKKNLVLKERKRLRKKIL